MTNYLNQIESDLYKLYSITNGSGEVVEMVAELKEKYRKAKAFDQTKETLKEDVEKLEKLEKDFPLSCQDELEKLNNILVLMTRYESGEPNAKK